MRLPWPLVFLFICSIVFFQTPARARDTEGKYTGTKFSCPEQFDALAVARSKHNNGMSFAPPSPELVPIVNALGNDLPAQAKELVELRILVEKHGKRFFQREYPDIYKKYLALEWKNAALGIIEGDIHGHEIWDGFHAFGKSTPTEQIIWLRKFAGSKHPQAGMLFSSLLNPSEPSEAQNYLRNIIAARGNILKGRVFGSTFVEDIARSPSNLPYFLKMELREMPDWNYQRLLEKLTGPDLAKATAGLQGRSNAFLENFVQSPNDMLALEAIRALRMDGSGEALRVFHKAAANPSLNVRVNMAHMLREFHDQEAAMLALKMAKDGDPELQVATRWVYEDYDNAQLLEGRYVLKRVAYGRAPSDAKLLETALHGDSKSALEAVHEMRYRSRKLQFETLEADDPIARRQMAIYLMSQSNAAEVAGKMMRDPVSDVRQAVLLQLHARGDDPNVIKLLQKVLEEDEDIGVRSVAQNMLMALGQNGGVDLASFRQTRGAYLENIRKQYGAGSLREQDVIPLAAADHVYNLPEEYLDKTPEELVELNRKFHNSAPLAYDPIYAVTDSLSGFKGAIYRSVNHDEPTIVALGGTQTLSDVTVDINMGTMQARSRNFTGMVKKIVDDHKRLIDQMKILGSRYYDMNTIPDIVVTGHSLGGGMAQVMGQDLVAAFTEAGLPEMAAKVRVVSWNGFGGVEPLKRAGRYSAEAAASLAERSTNYYLPTDKISRIGTHIGPMIPLPELKMNFLQSHKLGSMADAFLNRGGLETTEARDSARYRYAAAFSRVAGPLFDSIRFLRYKKQEWAIMEKLAYARLEWADQEGFKSMEHDFDWLKIELETSVDRLFGQGRRKEAREFLDKIESERLARLQARRLAPKPIAPES